MTATSNAVQEVVLVNLNKRRIKNVGVYARVSTDKTMAVHSLNTQIDYYADYIKNKPGWKFARIYSDEGISGTKEDRPGFLAMMEDCRNGKIDMIITKSISRFARNKVLLVSAIRELKALGIDVYFEKENMHTQSSTGEMMLTLLATFAEEEARSASENQLWRVRRKFKEGIPTYTRLLGYRMVDGQLQIIPEEAEVVRKIYDYYLSGMGLEVIARALTHANNKTICGTLFSTNNLIKILTNEKYAGNLMLQKTYKENYRTKRKMINKGEKPKYYVESAHEPIIDETTWNAVQKERERRRKLVSQNSLKAVPKKQHLFNGIITCGNCGKNFMYKFHNNKNTWICRTYLKYGKDICHINSVPEYALINKTKEAFKAILPKVDCDNITHEFLDEYLTNITVPENRKLIFNFKNGKTYEAEWKYKSRSESWTPEMKEKARQQNLARHKKAKEAEAKNKAKNRKEAK